MFFPGLFLLSACGGDDGGEGREVARVLLVYLGGDSNLSGEAALKLSALQEGWREGDAPVVVYRDDASAKGSCLLLLAGEREGWPAVDTLSVYGEENSADARVLARVAREVRERFPARSYGLLVFSHASGWLPAGTLQRPLTGGSRSLVVDEGDGARREMELADFAGALPEGMFDFIVFECCLTANVELAHALRLKCDYIVASCAEIVSPGFTPVYPGWLGRLLDGEGDLAGDLRAFAEGYFAHASMDPDFYFSATISVIRTAAMEELARVTRGIYRQQSGAFTGFEGLQRFDRPGRYDGDSPALARFFDLEQYVERVAAAGEYAAFREALGRVVVYEGHTSQFLLQAPGENGFEIDRHCGLTTYVERPELPFMNERYRETSWYGATR
jgi:hypothetical protein